MNCQEIQKCLSEFLDEHLEVERSQKVSDHLAACALCSEEMASLAECQRLVSSLPVVESPIGFTTRVMAHVRESARKQSLWERLFSPVRIKIPLQAAAVVLVAVLAAYIYHKEPTQRESVITVQPEKSPDKADETDKPPPITAQAPAGESKTTQASDAAKLPAQKFKDSADVPEPLAKSGEQDTGTSERRPTPATPSEDQVRSPDTLGPIPREKKFAEASEATSPRLEQSFPSGAAPTRGTPQSVPQAEKESGSKDTEFARKSLEAMERRASSSNPLSSSAVIGAALPADHELMIRLKEPVRDDKNMADRLGLASAQIERQFLTLQEQTKDLQQSITQAVQTGQPQTVWVTTARNQYQLFKKELAELGSIEVESSTPELKSDAIAKSSDRLRIKVTILPPLSAGNPLPSELLGR